MTNRLEPLREDWTTNERFKCSKPHKFERANFSPEQWWMAQREALRTFTAMSNCGHSFRDALASILVTGMDWGMNAYIENQEDKKLKTPIMKYFEYEHLPEHLQKVSKPVGDLAKQMNIDIPDSPEKSAGLRKLLEAKDCLVRAALD